jgi:K+-transporting ATPase ATPase A chain
VALGWTVLIGRFLMMIPVIALAGNLAQKKSVPPSPGTFPVNGSLFTVLLVGVIVILSALTFFPALSLGPILEHLQLHVGQLF